jgi:tetratricopeptide (TPR) repeat protein
VYKKRHQILGPHHHETVKSQANPAITLNEQGHHKQAEALYRQALAIFQEKLGVSHPDTLKTHTNLATALHDQGKFDEAESVVAFALPLLGKKFGVMHPEVLEALEFRAILLQHLGKFSKALGIAKELYEARKKKLGYDHDNTQRSLRQVRDLEEDVEEAHVMRSSPLAVSAACLFLSPSLWPPNPPVL